MKKIVAVVLVLVIASSFTVQAQTVDLQYCADFNSLAVYWLEDTSGQGSAVNPFTNHNGVAFNLGRFNKAADFGSTNSTKYLDTGTRVGYTGGDVTISLWVKISTEPSNESFRIIQLIDNTTSGTFFELRYADIVGSKTLEFSRTRIGTATVNFTSAQTLGTANWHHVVATYNGSTGVGTLYLDNVSLGTFTQTGTGGHIGQADNFVIGVFLDGNNLTTPSFLKGLVDEAVVDNTVWSVSRINAVFNRLNPPIGCSPSGTSNLDVPLSTRNAEVTQLLIKAKTDNLANLDILLSALRDAITAPAPNNKTLKDLFDKLQVILNQLDVALSTRASESTLVLANGVLDSIKAKTDNLDILLSTRASETTQLLVKSALDAIKTKTDNLDVLLSSRASELTLQGVKAGTDKIPNDPARESGNLAGVKTNTDNLVARTPKPWQSFTDSGKGFGVVTDAFLLATTNKTDVMLIKNPSASGIITRLKRLHTSPNRDFVNIEIYRNPTITSNGTSLTPFNHKLSGGSATTQVFQSPVISSRGTLVFTGKLGAFLNPIDFELAKFLESGESLLIVLQARVINIEVDLTLDFAEE